VSQNVLHRGGQKDSEEATNHEREEATQLPVLNREKNREVIRRLAPHWEALSSLAKLEGR
jgi:hypothetical protein